MEVAGVESIAASTLRISIEKKYAKNLSIFSHRLILALFLMTSHYHVSFSFPEEIDGSIDFLFVRSFLLSLIYVV